MPDKTKDKDICIAGTFVSLAPRKNNEGYTLKFIPTETEEPKIDELLVLSLDGTSVNIVIKVPPQKSSEKKEEDKKGQGKKKSTKI